MGHADSRHMDRTWPSNLRQTIMKYQVFFLFVEKSPIRRLEAGSLFYGYFGEMIWGVETELVIAYHLRNGLLLHTV